MHVSYTEQVDIRRHTERRRHDTDRWIEMQTGTHTFSHRDLTTLYLFHDYALRAMDRWVFVHIQNVEGRAADRWVYICKQVHRQSQRSNNTVLSHSMITRFVQ